MSTESSVEERWQLLESLKRYVVADDRLESASKEFHDSCQEIRRKSPKHTKRVFIVNEWFYLFTMDGDGNFEVEKVDPV